MTETAGGCVYDGRPLSGVRVAVTDGQVERVAGGDQRAAAVPAEAREVGGGLITGPHPHVCGKAELGVLQWNEPTEKSRWAKVFDEVR